MNKNSQSKSFSLAVNDQDFLYRDEMRGVRFLLEYGKTEIMLRDQGIRSTIVVFGGARIPSREYAEALLASATTPEEIVFAKAKIEQSRWYEDARVFGRIASERGGSLSKQSPRDNVIATGGGPGIMEAANRGATEAGAPTIGFNIELPFEQEPNPYSSEDLTFNFHYFAMRKMHLAMRATALVAFPGGFGTLDEIFEILTLMSTGRMGRAPVIFYDEKYWREIVNIDGLLKYGMISPSDMDLFDFANTPEEAWEKLLIKGLGARIPETPDFNPKAIV